MIKAVIFDFDGVIADTEHIHFEAFKNVLNMQKYDITESEYYSEYLAYDDKTFFSKYYENNGYKLDSKLLNRLVKKKSQEYDALIEDNIRVYPGIVDFIKLLSGRYTLAIGSGALKKEIVQILQVVNLADLFKIIISADDISECKPNPEVYNTVLARLNSNRDKIIRPEECIVIEDSVYGIRAAKGAGMK
ncbi:MAG: HAD-IA family hydrolase, partial [Candidatus Dadabacteria bacterium]|nr:HAD-IA family hydrolase [Candidatus Dadabacteria bacterium]NIQ14607.1 HAD-IA family hydrolase [Candidatus Dadabacteria bacterium]